METARRWAGRLTERLAGGWPWALPTAVFVVADVVWISMDRLPPMWDQASYLAGSEVLLQALLGGGLPGLARAFTVVSAAKAPLLSLLPLPFYLVFGHGHHVALAVGVVLLAVGSWLVYRLAGRLRGRRAAVWAVAMFNLFPLVAGLSREFLVETCLTVLVLAWHVCLVESEGLRRRGTWWRLGIVLGLGMLTKILFPLYVAGGSIYVLWRRVREDGGVRRGVVAVTVGSVACGLAIAATWYARNLRGALSTAFGSGFGATAGDYGSRSVMALGTLSAYWLRVAAEAVSPTLTLVLVTTLVATAVSMRRGRLEGPVFRDPAHLRLLLWWLAVPFVVLSMGVNKDIRFLVPVLPALAILGAAGMDALARGRAAAASIAAVGALAFAALMAGSFAPASTVARTPAPVRSALFAGTAGYVRAPVDEEWPLADLDRALEADAAAHGITAPGVTLLFDHPRINADNMGYVRAAAGGTAVYRTGAYITSRTDAAGESIVLGYSDYLVTKTGDLGPSFTNVLNRRIAADIVGGPLPYDLTAQTRLPDGSFLRVFRRRQ